MSKTIEEYVVNRLEELELENEKLRVALNESDAKVKRYVELSKKVRGLIEFSKDGETCRANLYISNKYDAEKYDAFCELLGVENED